MVRQDALLNFQAVNFAGEDVDLALGCLVTFFLKDLVSTKALFCQFVKLAHETFFFDQKSLDPSVELFYQLILLLVEDSELDAFFLELAVAGNSDLDIALDGHIDVADAFVAQTFRVPSVIKPFRQRALRVCRVTFHSVFVRSSEGRGSDLRRLKISDESQGDEVLVGLSGSVCVLPGACLHVCKFLHN